MNPDRGVLRKLKGLLGKMPMMLTCQEFEDFVLDYFEGTLTAKENAIFKMHLLVCTDCKRYLAAYKRSVELGQNLFKEPNSPVPDDMPEDLVQAILAAKESEPELGP